jgi:hypothetical protein
MLVPLFAGLVSSSGCIAGAPAFGSLPPSASLSPTAYGDVEQSPVLGDSHFRQAEPQAVEPGETTAGSAPKEAPIEPDPRPERPVDQDDRLVNVEADDESRAARLSSLNRLDD